MASGELHQKYQRSRKNQIGNRLKRYTYCISSHERGNHEESTFGYSGGSWLDVGDSYGPDGRQRWDGGQQPQQPGGMTGSQQSHEVMKSQTMSQDMMNDMTGMMKQMNEMMQKMSHTMEHKTVTEHAMMQDMGKMMHEMAAQMNEMATHMEQGKMDKETVKKMHEKMRSMNQKWMQCRRKVNRNAQTFERCCSITVYWKL